MITAGVAGGQMRRAYLLLTLLGFLSGCQQVHFYQQAIVGQSKLLLERERVDALLESSELDPALRHRLMLSQDIVQFAEARGLAANGAYDSYVVTGQPFVIWNVFAAQPYRLSLEPSCFPVAGCVSYRGYFNREDAIDYARHLQTLGYETYIGGVAAYSTLGWFDDPLLDTFLFRAEEDLAALLFHELAHQLIYIKGDTRFNESLATAVERYLLQDWLIQNGDQGRYQRYLARRARISAVIELIDDTRLHLKALYSSSLSEDAMRREKDHLLKVLVQNYEALSDTWEEGEEYRAWMQSPINNAKLETVADYHEWVPVMLQKLQRIGLDRFIHEMRELAKLSQSDREQALRDYRSR